VLGAALYRRQRLKITARDVSDADSSDTADALYRAIVYTRACATGNKLLRITMSNTAISPFMNYAFRVTEEQNSVKIKPHAESLFSLLIQLFYYTL
jgi:hypothetical protein